jgi:predicted HTH transcriptional regulator
LRKTGIRLIIYENEGPNSEFYERVKRDISAISGASEDFIILGVDGTGKISGVVSECCQPGTLTR